MRAALACWLVLALGCSRPDPGGGGAAAPAGDPAGVASDHGVTGERECFTVAACQPACSEGQPGSCQRLAQFVEQGWGVPRDRRRARELRAAACRTGDAAACFESLSSVDAVSVAALAQRCEAGTGRACYVLARKAFVDRIARDVDDLDTDAAEAGWDDKACRAGYAYSCEITVNELTGGKTPHPGGRRRVAELEARALELRQADCAWGVTFACHQLGLLLSSSYNARASELAGRQCARGYPPACDRHAKLLEQAEGVARDPAAAAASRRRACELRGDTTCPPGSP